MELAYVIYLHLPSAREATCTLFINVRFQEITSPVLVLLIYLYIPTFYLLIYSIDLLIYLLHFKHIMLNVLFILLVRVNDNKT